MYCNLINFWHFKLRIRTDDPDFSDILPIPEYYDWKNTAYGEHLNKLPVNTPNPLGKHIVLTHYYDASLMNDVLSGKAGTGILHFYNKIPVDWYCTKKSITKMATYGSKFISYYACFE